MWLMTQRGQLWKLLGVDHPHSARIELTQRKIMMVRPEYFSQFAEQLDSWTVHLDDDITRHVRCCNRSQRPNEQFLTASNIRFRFIRSYANQWLVSVVSVSPSSMAQMNFASCGSTVLLVFLTHIQKKTSCAAKIHWPTMIIIIFLDLPRDCAFFQWENHGRPLLGEIQNFGVPQANPSIFFPMNMAYLNFQFVHPTLIRSVVGFVHI